MRRCPRGYDGNGKTNHQLSDVAGEWLRGMEGRVKDQPELVVGAWKEIVGARFATMTEALTFREGVLEVRVNNSTLYSLLSRNDKPRLIAAMRERFPKISIYNILFRIG